MVDTLRENFRSAFGSVMKPNSNFGKLDYDALNDALGINFFRKSLRLKYIGWDLSESVKIVINTAFRIFNFFADFRDVTSTRIFETNRFPIAKNNKIIRTKGRWRSLTHLEDRALLLSEYIKPFIDVDPITHENSFLNNLTKGYVHRMNCMFQVHGYRFVINFHDVSVQVMVI